MNILVETSARHVHVTEADLETLFGKGYQLTVKKELSQPGQYASNERVTARRRSLPMFRFSARAAAPRRWS